MVNVLTQKKEHKGILRGDGDVESAQAVERWCHEHTRVQTQQDIHIKCMGYFVYQLYLSKA